MSEEEVKLIADAMLWTSYLYGAKLRNEYLDSDDDVMAVQLTDTQEWHLTSAGAFELLVGLEGSLDKIAFGASGNEWSAKMFKGPGWSHAKTAREAITQAALHKLRGQHE